MPRKKNLKPQWHKDKSQAVKDLLLNTPDEVVGKAYKMAISYFDKAEITDIDNLGIQDAYLKTIFTIFKQWCDEGIKDFEASVAYGHQGQEAKKAKQNNEEGIAPL